MHPALCKPFCGSRWRPPLLSAPRMHSDSCADAARLQALRQRISLNSEHFHHYFLQKRTGVMRCMTLSKRRIRTQACVICDICFSALAHAQASAGACGSSDCEISDKRTGVMRCMTPVLLVEMRRIAEPQYIVQITSIYAQYIVVFQCE